MLICWLQVAVSEAKADEHNKESDQGKAGYDARQRLIEGETVPMTEEAGIVLFSKPSGFYDEPFRLQLATLAAGDTIRYTLDGSDPRYASDALMAVSPFHIMADPGSTEGGRGQTGGVVVRASVSRTAEEPGRAFVRTYIFLDQVIRQTHPGGSWPVSSINRQVIDLTMDARVTNSSRYRDQMRDAFLDIPSISITTDMANLFDAQTGIYVNANRRGREWERPGQIELIYPDGSHGFNVNLGIRIRGGWSRHPEFAKHAFRLFFRSDYGDTKLIYPLFGDEGVDEFHKVDLRTSQNYSWSKGGHEGKHNTMNRDVFSRDTQRDIGQPYTRSRYYHLYINGLYWGLFQTQERAEARFAASYFDGRRSDYDVVKVNIGDNWNLYEIGATDGNLDAWRAIWEMCQHGFADNEDYFRLMGANAAGEPDTTMNVWVDIDNLIDYMMIIFYGGNFDAPLSKFRNNADPNNFYAIYDRGNHRAGFKFFIHDAEHSLLTDPVGPGDGLYENRVNIGNISSRRMNVTRFEKFHPQWLHHRLTQNTEYRQRFADRAHRQFSDTGVFSPEASIRRFRATADQLDLAIIAESARWGKMGVTNPRNKYDDWVPAVNRVINRYFPYRTDIVIQQLIDEQLYPTLKDPEIRYLDELLLTDTLSVPGNAIISLRNPNASSTIFYTLDGSDPRAVGGGKGENAKTAGNFRQLDVEQGAQLFTRVYDGSNWSAPRLLTIMEEPPATNDLELPPMSAIEQHQAIQINLDELFTTHFGPAERSYETTNSRPAFVAAAKADNSLSLTPLQRGDTNIHIEATDSAGTTQTIAFRVLVYPSAHPLSEQDFLFQSWSASEPEYSYPAHMLFLQSDINDPGLTYPLRYPYYVAHDDYHARDEDNIGFPYASSGRTRINALEDDGISFINTGRGRDLGGAVLALDTRGVNNLQMQWTAGTMLPNDRIYAIRLQYRTSLDDDFQDLLIHGMVQEYVTSFSGHITTFDAASLPAALLNQEYLQLMWRYFHIAGTSGPRAELRLDDIHIGTTVNVTETHPTMMQIFTHDNRLIMNTSQTGSQHLRLFNMMGQVVLQTTVEGAGRHMIQTNLPSGIYVVRLEGSTGIDTKKVLIANP